MIEKGVAREKEGGVKRVMVGLAILRKFWATCLELYCLYCIESYLLFVSEHKGRTIKSGVD